MPDHFDLVLSQLSAMQTKEQLRLAQTPRGWAVLLQEETEAVGELDNLSPLVSMEADPLPPPATYTAFETKEEALINWVIRLAQHEDYRRTENYAMLAEREQDLERAKQRLEADYALTEEICTRRSALFFQAFSTLAQGAQTLKELERYASLLASFLRPVEAQSTLTAHLRWSGEALTWEDAAQTAQSTTDSRALALSTYKLKAKQREAEAKQREAAASAPARPTPEDRRRYLEILASLGIQPTSNTQQDDVDSPEE